ncbi:MAG: UDP-N-acetylglucosamine--N-acetylmuramyl-(pentapeptide) pyrophosphoryl-undecaprenol N-acetylglucosamine transferase [Opitutales bacterium]|nr:UDP-N-acetylglucosamine--N-acetylmuramyl-(pentapeptide) pyrophosphoryl-undecaprenol N-acetylglucosamine transferase [Opitutales bacterium]
MKKKKSFIIACGGTGGHLSPGIALAQRLTARGYHCTLLLSRKKIDSRLSEKYTDLDFVRISGCAFGLKPIKLIKFFYNLVLSVFASLFLFLRRRPAAFVSFGGFLTIGSAIASKLLFIPVVLHEANRVPGKSVRFMSGMAARVYLPPGVRLSGARRFATRSAGFPVREEMRALDKAASRQKFELPQTGKLLMVFGGSQGAHRLNEWAKSIVPEMLGLGVSMMVITGPEQKTDFSQVPTKNEETGACAKFIPFCDDMASALSAADLIVSRAGAGSLAEFVACCAPAVLVPYPLAADNHQLANAEFFREKGAGVLIEEKNLDTLTPEVKAIILDDELLGRFRDNIRRMQREFDWSNVVNDLVNFAEGRSRTLKSEQA